MSRGTWELNEEGQPFRLQDYHLLWLPFPEYSAEVILFNSLIPSCRNLVKSHDTASTTRTSLNMDAVWAIPRSLATTKGIAVAFFSSRY